MAVFPSWVVLRSRVPVFLDSKKGQGWETIGRADKVPVAGDGDGPMASMILRAFTLDAHLVHPPEISTLALRAKWDVPEISFFCYVHSVHENLIVIMIYSMRRDTNNYLLVHDAPTNSLSLVPHVLNTKDSTIHSLCFFCFPPVALRIDDGYSLANLAFERDFTGSGRRVLPSSGTLFWWSSTSPGRWTPMEARFNEHGTLPAEQSRGASFNADVTFIFQGKAFWVDLLLGVVVCDLLANKSVAELKFVGLPPGCEWPNNIDVLDYLLSRGQPEDHRTMGVVGDMIRFVSLSVANCEGYPKHPSPRKIMVKTWTLVVVERQLQWERNHDMTLALTQLWKCKTFRREMLPRCAIMRPVLSPKEDGIVYFLLGDYYTRRDCIGTLSRGESLICVDMRSKTLISRSYLPLNTGLHRPHRKPIGSPDDREFYPEIPCICGGSMFDITEAKNQLKKKRRNTAISDGNCEAKELMKKKKDNYEAKELMNMTNVRV